MPELWLTERCPASVFVDTNLPLTNLPFVDTNLPYQRLRIRKSDDEIGQLDDDSTEIFKSNVTERYCDRPNSTFINGKFETVNNICLTEFAAYYYKDYHSRKESNEGNDCQPEILTDDVIEPNLCPGETTNFRNHLPQSFKLISKNETNKCRKMKVVIRSYSTNKVSKHEIYCHHLLMLYYPWRSESELLGPDAAYSSKLNYSIFAEKVNKNGSKFEVDSNGIDEAFEYVRNNPAFDNFCDSLDAINEQENSDIRGSIDFNVNHDVNDLEIDNDPNSLLSEPSSSITEIQTQIPMCITLQPAKIQDDIFQNMVRSLNAK